MTAELVQQLEAFLRTEVGTHAPTVSGLQRLGIGRSRENWIFDARWPDGHLDHLILRQDPTGGLVDTDRAVEFAALRALESTGLAVPRALWLDAKGEHLDRPSLIMVREAGNCEYDVLASARPLGIRQRLAREFCELMAAVHSVDWQALGVRTLLADPGPQPSLTELRRWESILRHDQVEAYPELELVIDYLAAAAPTCAARTLVHADFKPGNILLDHDDIVALLDWELVHIGDPLEDLGWVTQPLRAREHLIPGVWERADLITHYETVRGVNVAPAAVTWWSTFAGFKTAVMQVSGLRAFLDGRSDHPYRPTRKVLLTLLRSIGGDDAADNR